MTTSVITWKPFGAMTAVWIVRELLAGLKVQVTPSGAFRHAVEIVPVKPVG